MRSEEEQPPASAAPEAGRSTDGGTGGSAVDGSSGLAANGLDFLHVFVGLALPSLATTMLWIAGVFYLAWFPLLARDLLKRGQA